jgi:hypothetical protein
MISIRFLVFCAIALFFSSAILPSKYVSRTGHIHVESANRFKDIVADNYQVYSEVIPTTGAVSFTGLMKSFEFELGALDQAFNSSRLDLSHYSKFKFEGELSNNQSIKWDQAGTYPVMVTGLLYIGSFKRKTSAQGNIIVGNDGKIRADAAFTIVIEEESVKTINKMMKEKLPSVMALDVDKLGISRNINLTLTAAYRPRG